MRAWSNEEIKRYLGPHEACYLTYATDPAVRNGAASGGSTSQIAIQLLERNLVDGVLVWKMVCGGDEPRVDPCIATTRDEVLSARGSKYCAVSYPRQALPAIEAFEGRLAVMALPCDASYLRRKMRKDPDLTQKIHCILTLFCGHNSEPELTKIVAKRHLGVDWEDVADFKYRTGSWRGLLSVRTKDGRELSTPTPTFTHYQNLHFFSQRKCLSCVDHYGFDGDLCVGDTWSLDMKKRNIKPTLVVARTKRGAELLQQASEGLHLEAVEPRTVVHGNSRGLTYHYNVSARSKVAPLFGLRIKDTLRLPTTPLDRLIALIGVFNFSWSLRPNALISVARLPKSAVVAYIYLFKGLQQASLLMHRPFPPQDKVSLIGATLTGNRGAEAMLVTTIGKLRQFMPDDRFIVHSYFPEQDRALCRDLNVEVVDARPVALVCAYFPFALVDRALRVIGLGWPRSWMPRNARELSESKALLDLSGISFSDGREKFLPFNVLNNWPALMMDVPVVRLSQGLGEYRGRINRVVSRWMLRRCAKVFARGQHSYETTRELGVGETLDLAADIAFCFDESDSLTDENPSYEHAIMERIESIKTRATGVLALSVSSVVHNKCLKRGVDYPESMAHLIELLSDKGIGVVILPNATRQGVDSLHNNDLPIVQDIANRLSQHAANLVVPLERDLNTRSLRRVLGRCDWLVASRFHAMIAGLCLEMPTMVLGWGHKYREVLDQFGIAEWAWDYTELDITALAERIEALIEQQDDVRGKIASRLNAVRALSMHQFEWLQNFLKPELPSYDEEPEPLASAAHLETADRDGHSRRPF